MTNQPAMDADDLFRGEHPIEEALTKLAEECCRAAILRCAEIARKRGAGNVAEDIIELLDVT